MEENLSAIVRVRPPLHNEIAMDQCVEVARVGSTNAIKLRTKNHNVTCDKHGDKSLNTKYRLYFEYIYRCKTRK